MQLKELPWFPQTRWLPLKESSFTSSQDSLEPHPCLLGEIILWSKVQNSNIKSIVSPSHHEQYVTTWQDQVLHIYTDALLSPTCFIIISFNEWNHKMQFWRRMMRRWAMSDYLHYAHEVCWNRLSVNVWLKAWRFGSSKFLASRMKQIRNPDFPETYSRSPGIDKDGGVLKRWMYCS